MNDNIFSSSAIEKLMELSEKKGKTYECIFSNMETFLDKSMDFENFINKFSPIVFISLIGEIVDNYFITNDFDLKLTEQFYKYLIDISKGVHKEIDGVKN